MLVNSVPLSLTIDNGLPRWAMMASSARPTRAPDKDVSATSVRHSRVKSSTTARIRIRRLSVSVSLRNRATSAGSVLAAMPGEPLFQALFCVRRGGAPEDVLRDTIA